MGGVQVIALGDFYQLKPVPNKWTGDPGNYCFLSNVWPFLFPHAVVLRNVHRQDNMEFITAISETARGCPSDATVEIIKALNEPRSHAAKLYARRMDVYISNHDSLKAVDGQLHTLKSLDNEHVSPKVRASVDAPKQLLVKVNAPVLLTVNVSPRLVNGLIGRVVCVKTESVDVYFHDIHETHGISRCSYYQFVEGKSIFVCKQFPLALAYALTIHKCQGMTLNNAVVDCAGAFDPGQVSVALGRVRSPDDLTVLNFRRGLCPPHPPCVNAFYGTVCVETLPDGACCKATYVGAHQVEVKTNAICGDDIEEGSDCGSEDDGDDNHDIYVHDLNVSTKSDVSALRSRLMFKICVTECQKAINQCMIKVDDVLFNRFVYVLEERLTHICSTQRGANKCNASVNLFLNVYGNSPEFHDLLKTTFACTVLQQSHMYIGMQSLIFVQNSYYQCVSSSSPHDEDDETHFVAQGSGDGKLRYLAGMCVGKVLYRDTQFVCRNVMKDDVTVTTKKESIAALRKHLFNSKEMAINETEYPESLNELRHRQTQFGHLTFLNDCFFFFFKELQQLVLPLLNTHNLMKYKCLLFSEIMQNILSSASHLGVPEGLTIEQLTPVIEKYVKVCLKEMGMRVEKKCQISKKLAHRKQVLLEEGTSTKHAAPVAVDVPESEPCVGEDGDTYWCKVCQKPYKDKQRLLWIECCDCMCWLHRKCDKSLKSQKVWKLVSAVDAHYSCPSCLKNKVTACILLVMVITGYCFLSWHALFLECVNLC